MPTPPASPKLTIPLTEFDRQLVANTPTNDARTPIAEWVREHWRGCGGNILALSVDATEIQLVWQPDPAAPEPALSTAQLLAREEWAAARVVLGLLRQHPTYAAQPEYAYQLGRVYFELQLPEHALQLLESAAQADPPNGPALAALGWAYVLVGRPETALPYLQRAAQQEPLTAETLYDLGSAFAQAAHLAEGVAYLRRATALAPEQARGWLALGQALELSNAVTEADSVYARVIALDEWHPRAVTARAARSRLANAQFHAAVATERLDAVMYCLGALRRYARLTPEQAHTLFHDIALQGAQGFDLDNADRQYAVRVFPGETFSGLNMVCLLYVGIKHLALPMDIGFDLNREYDLADQIWRSQT